MQVFLETRFSPIISEIELSECLLSCPIWTVMFSCFLQTSRGEFDASEFEVRRRYQDFLWLKGKLEEAHPTLIIPVSFKVFLVVVVNIVATVLF